MARSLIPDAPRWDGIVEEAFPPAAATDQMVFFDADTPEKLEADIKRMMDSCARFADNDRFQTYPMRSYVLKR